MGPTRLRLRFAPPRLAKAVLRPAVLLSVRRCTPYLAISSFRAYCYSRWRTLKKRKMVKISCEGYAASFPPSTTFDSISIPLLPRLYNHCKVISLIIGFQAVLQQEAICFRCVISSVPTGLIRRRSSRTRWQIIEKFQGVQCSLRLGGIQNLRLFCANMVMYLKGL